MRLPFGKSSIRSIPGFLSTDWAGRTVGDLFEYVRTAMPPDNPGSRSDQEYIDSIAQMFALSNMPAGEKELPPDPEALGHIDIEAQP
jgi:hypothetical protein